MPITDGALGIVPECLEKRQEELEIIGITETMQATTFLRPARILRRVLEI